MVSRIFSTNHSEHAALVVQEKIVFNRQRFGWSQTKHPLSVQPRRGVERYGEIEICYAVAVQDLSIFCICYVSYVSIFVRNIILDYHNMSFLNSIPSRNSERVSQVKQVSWSLQHLSREKCCSSWVITLSMAKLWYQAGSSRRFSVWLVTSVEFSWLLAISAFCVDVTKKPSWLAECESLKLRYRMLKETSRSEG